VTATAAGGAYRMFQSAPWLITTENLWAWSAGAFGAKFQSAPWLITTENAAGLDSCGFAFPFQSAPWLITTENTCRHGGNRPPSSFNPLRGSSPRRTRVRTRQRPRQEVSIRSVAHHHGEHRLLWMLPRRTVFQSAPW